MPSVGRARRQRYTLLSLPVRSTSCTRYQILITSERQDRRSYTGRIETIGVVAMLLLRPQAPFKQLLRTC
jgi:hypothetical protein